MPRHVSNILIIKAVGEGYVCGDQFYPEVKEDIKKASRFAATNPKDAKSYLKNASKKLKNYDLKIVPAEETRDDKFVLLDVKEIN